MKQSKRTRRNRKTPKKKGLRILRALLLMCLLYALASPSLRARLLYLLTETPLVTETAVPTEVIPALQPDALPAWSGSPYVEVNGNRPYFASDTDTLLEALSGESEFYGDLDLLGRCTVACACIGPDTMPADQREEIYTIHPSGWQSTRYEGIDQDYLYNRCHLIGFQLTGENANERNLITGTRYLNIEGMLPFENAVAQYIRRTGHHVLYRVTPLFQGSNLVASGVLLEALSLEDTDLSFNVYCYNVQPGIVIDYATGGSHREGSLS